MLIHRLWMGLILIALMIVLLSEGSWGQPYYPVFFCTISVALLLATRELIMLLPQSDRPYFGIQYLGVGAHIAANWVNSFREIPFPTEQILAVQLAILVGFTILTLVLEMFCYGKRPNVLFRVGFTAFMLIYLGILPTFFIQARWFSPEKALLALGLLVFVPKTNDIGAYFTGKFLTGKILGRKQMAPTLSPKKTWQGFCGGMIIGTVFAVVFSQIYLPTALSILQSTLFGVTVGLAGVLGDLAESLLKRELGKKDASRTLPGFGGVLDLIDSLLFAAPIGYLWLIFH
ncbi:MAG: CDP-archaeol synthase [Zavarzinella sp.]